MICEWCTATCNFSFNLAHIVFHNNVICFHSRLSSHHYCHKKFIYIFRNNSIFCLFDWKLHKSMCSCCICTWYGCTVKVIHILFHAAQLATKQRASNHDIQAIFMTSIDSIRRFVLRSICIRFKIGLNELDLFLFFLIIILYVDAQLFGKLSLSNS